MTMAVNEVIRVGAVEVQYRLLAEDTAGTLTVFAIAADGSLSPLGEPVSTREDVTAVLIHYPR